MAAFTAKEVLAMYGETMIGTLLAALLTAAGGWVLARSGSVGPTGLRRSVAYVIRIWSTIPQWLLLFVLHFRHVFLFTGMHNHVGLAFVAAAAGTGHAAAAQGEGTRATRWAATARRSLHAIVLLGIFGGRGLGYGLSFEAHLAGPGFWLMLVHVTVVLLLAEVAVWSIGRRARVTGDVP